MHDLEANNAVEVSDLCVAYGKQIALADINLILPRGRIVALIGPNGAGKTTLLSAMFGVIPKSSGTINVCGHNPYDLEQQRLLHRIARFITLEPTILQLYLTVREYLTLHSHMNGVRRQDIEATVQSVIGDFGLAIWSEKRIATLSHGTKRKVHIASGFLSSVGGPQFVALDEPFDGLDPDARREVRLFLEEYVGPPSRASSRTVVISSHSLAELGSISTHVVAMREGRIIESGEVSALLAAHTQSLNYQVRLFGDYAEQFAQWVAQQTGLDCEILDSSSVLVSGMSQESVRLFFDCADQNGGGFAIREFREWLSPLETIFYNAHRELNGE